MLPDVLNTCHRLFPRLSFPRRLNKSVISHHVPFATRQHGKKVGIKELPLSQTRLFTMKRHGKDGEQLVTVINCIHVKK